jgi:hypothetical protein
MEEHNWGGSMQDVIWRTGVTLVALAVLAALGSNVSCGAGHYLLEQALGQTPEAQIGNYFEAIASGDRQGALDLLSVGTSPTADLRARRESVTDELLAYGAGLEYEVLDAEWWRTCCEPAVIDDPTQAGGVRTRVVVRNEKGRAGAYRLDLLVPGGYWGDAAGNPVRRWRLADVYPDGEPPLVWPWR